MPKSFNQQFDQHGAWRRQFALRLKLLADWMGEHELLDTAVEERLRRLETQVRSDKVMVAFVAEFSRGKSELINAIFFAGYGRRIMPASAGRTTMCPTELGYDADVPPCLRLLPIETREQPQTLMEWREKPEKWTRVDLDVSDAAQLASAMQKVAEVRHVSKDEARALGFWNDETPDDNPIANAAGLVEIPRWRHALINIAHPLLKQGLVILDTPGLNAIGAEPELTVSLIPQAHAVVFILAADAGVTKSDLAIWREHLITEGNRSDARLVVLNKIDTLWDALSTAEQIQAQIDRQRTTAAGILGLPQERVVPVSAQKGLLAKVSKDDKLLKHSGLPRLEDVLGQGMLGRREAILRAAIDGGIAELRTEASRVLNIRRRDLADQMLELQGLRGKNTNVIRNMRARIEQEQVEFEVSGAKIQAVRSVHLKLLREVFDILGSNGLKATLSELNAALRQPGIKLGVKRSYDDAFRKLTDQLTRVQSLTSEIQAMLGAMFRQLNAEYSFSLQAPKEPEMSRFVDELVQIEQSHLQYLGVGNIIRLAQPEFSDRLVRALFTRLRMLYDNALSEVELWSKGAAAQLDAQLRERRRNFGRRLEAIERIQQAAGGLDGRIGEIEGNGASLDELDAKLRELTSHLLTPPPTAVAAAAPTPDAEVSAA
ncbi:dynamin family protein [Variovorax sp. VNK109]|uniref:dynamin family protein n=1 Tax=Variovorax sp. VNK109 TaxID=3400919 RepID=UPI003C0EFAD8